MEAFRFQGSAAMERAAAESLAHQTSIDGVLRIAHTLLDDGRHAWSREAYYLAAQLGPNRAPRSPASPPRGRPSPPTRRAPAAPLRAARLTESSLARAHDLEPSDASIKAEIAYRRAADAPSGQVAAREVQPDEAYLVKPEVFLRMARERPAKKGEIFDRQIHWVRVVTYHPDKRVSQLMHYTREIVIEPRTEQDLYENVPARATRPSCSSPACTGRTAPWSSPRSRAPAAAGPTSAGPI